MSDDNQFVAETLEELLASIADGVREAQMALSEAPPFDAFGRPLPTYHMPYIDFDLKVDMSTMKTSSGSRLLRIIPLGKNQQNNSSKEISTTLSGRFVAIPPGDGLPLPILNLTSTRLSARKHSLAVEASNSAGEVLQNATIELNLNLTSSKQLSSVEGVTINSLRTSRLDDALLVTNELGQATTVLTIDSGIPAKASLVVSAEFDSQVSNIVVAAGSES